MGGNLSRTPKSGAVNKASSAAAISQNAVTPIATPVMISSPSPNPSTEYIATSIVSPNNSASPPSPEPPEPPATHIANTDDSMAEVEYPYYAVPESGNDGTYAFHITARPGCNSYLVAALPDVDNDALSAGSFDQRVKGPRDPSRYSKQLDAIVALDKKKLDKPLSDKQSSHGFLGANAEVGDKASALVVEGGYTQPKEKPRASFERHVISDLDDKKETDLLVTVLQKSVQPVD